MPAVGPIEGGAEVDQQGAKGGGRQTGAEVEEREAGAREVCAEDQVGRPPGGGFEVLARVEGNEVVSVVGIPALGLRLP